MQVATEERPCIVNQRLAVFSDSIDNFLSSSSITCYEGEGDNGHIGRSKWLQAHIEVNATRWNGMRIIFILLSSDVC